MTNVAALLAAYAKEFNCALEKFLPEGGGPVADAMRYSMQDGGKRLRPALVMAFCEKFGGMHKDALPFAVSLEMVHTYSLIHDDLPCMDDDDFRRGRPSCHKRFGEAAALLAGDALLTQAFAVIAGAEHLPEATRCEAVAQLAKSAGYLGMIGGQMLDMAYEKMQATREQLEEMNRKKTGELIRLACRFGAMAARAGEAQLAAAEAYADALGVLFQVTDDILDMTGNTSKFGKSIGKDAASGKSTWVSLLGLDGAKQYADELSSLAYQAITPYTAKDEFLLCLPEWIVNRDH